MISVVEIVLRKLQRPVVTDAPQFQLRSFGVPPPVRPKQPMTVLSQEINIFGEHHVARISDHMDKFQLWKSLCQKGDQPLTTRIFPTPACIWRGDAATMQIDHPLEIAPGAGQG